METLRHDTITGCVYARTRTAPVVNERTRTAYNTIAYMHHHQDSHTTLWYAECDAVRGLWSRLVQTVNLPMAADGGTRLCPIGHVVSEPEGSSHPLQISDCQQTP
jgi:hypothetical protein